jgi:hypothetical protein
VVRGVFMKYLLKKYKKKIIIIVAIPISIFIVKVIYAKTYVGDILVSYPWDEYTISEKVAAKLSSFDHMTKQEMYDNHLIDNTNGPFRKFDESHYDKK